MTTVEKVTDRVGIPPPFLLKIDDDEQLIEERADLVNVREHIRIDDDSLGGLESTYIDPTPFQGTVTLLIKDRVIAVAAYHRKGPQVCHIIKHPDGTLAVHFVNTYKPLSVK